MRGILQGYKKQLKRHRVFFVNIDAIDDDNYRRLRLLFCKQLRVELVIWVNDHVRVIVCKKKNIK